MAHRGCVQGRTGDDRVYRGSVQWHTGDVQGMTVKTQGVTGEDRGFSYGQGFLEPVVMVKGYFNYVLKACVKLHIFIFLSTFLRNTRYYDVNI